MSAWKGWERPSRGRCFKDTLYDSGEKFDLEEKVCGWDGKDSSPRPVC